MPLDAHGLVMTRERPPIPGGPQTVPEMLSRAARVWEPREALVGRFARYTYAELAAQVELVAAQLAARGVRAGDRVGVCLPNHPDIVVCFLATMRLGAIWVRIHRALAPPERRYIVDDADVAVLLDDDVVDPVGFASTGIGGVVAPLGPVRVDPFAPAAIAYTSGTTGYPKGAVHSQHNLLLPGAVQRATRTYEPDLRQGVCLPLTVLNLVVLAPLVSFQLGACLVCMDRTDPLGIAEWVRDEEIATFSAVPAMIHGLLTHPDVTDEDLRSLVRPGVGGADLPEAFRTLYRDRFGAEVTIGYGLTEAPTAVTVTDPTQPPIPGEAGVPLPQVEVEIVEDDRVLSAGQPGEICVRARGAGPWAGVYTPMLGYWNRPDATRAALRGGRLHTGDIGLLDEGGHLFVKDRRNDLIVRGGANVYPAEVERVLHALPAVEACAVLGYPDEHYGERVAAFVQLASPVPAEELTAHCRESLAAYKVPDRWIVVDDFPRNAMGKIRKPELRRRLAASPQA
jgi:acyl-CoA synthetase (AMP-forming)/AMP-acid ligase II